MYLSAEDREKARDRADEDRPRGYCIACQCWTESARRDFGIGPFEYWGSREVHHDWREVCPSCEGDLLDEEPCSEDADE